MFPDASSILAASTKLENDGPDLGPFLFLLHTSRKHDGSSSSSFDKPIWWQSGERWGRLMDSTRIDNEPELSEAPYHALCRSSHSTVSSAWSVA